MTTIDFLKNHPAAIPQLADIWYDVLGRVWMPNKPIEKTQEDLRAHLNSDTLPITLVALEEGVPIAMCSLRDNDGISPDYVSTHNTAWLGSLVVRADHQGKGIGTQLIKAIQDKAKVLGFEKLYLFAFDPTIPDYYSRLGWVTVGMDEYAGHPVTVMGFFLTPEVKI